MKTSRAMVLEGPRRMVLREFPLPQIGPEEALLRVEMVGVCGSDVGIYRGKSHQGAPSLSDHHGARESFGTVAEIGREASRRRDLKEGDRVIVEYAFGCGKCFYCTRGDYIHCESFQVYGSMISCKEPPHLWGAYSEYLYLPPRARVHRVKKDLPPEVEYQFCAVLGNGVRWLRMIGGISAGDTVGDRGTGTTGLARVIVAKEAGAGKVIVTGMSRDRRRMELAKTFGADVTIDVEKSDPVEAVSELTEGRMADIVMDVSGNPKGAVTAINLVGKKGTGGYPGALRNRQGNPSCPR